MIVESDLDVVAELEVVVAELSPCEVVVWCEVVVDSELVVVPFPK